MTIGLLFTITTGPLAGVLGKVKLTQTIFLNHNLGTLTSFHQDPGFLAHFFGTALFFGISLALVKDPRFRKLWIAIGCMWVSSAFYALHKNRFVKDDHKELLTYLTVAETIIFALTAVPLLLFT